MITIYFGKLAKAKAEARVYQMDSDAGKWSGTLELQDKDGNDVRIYVDNFTHKVEAINALFEAAEKIGQSVRVLADESNMGDFRDSIELVNEKLVANGAEALQE